MPLSTKPFKSSRTGDLPFRTIFEQSPVSTQIFAPDGMTIAVNRAWEELWGVTLEGIGGYNILQDDQLVQKGVMPYIQPAFHGEYAKIPAIRYEPEKSIPDTGAVPYRWVRASIYPVRDEDGNICEVVLTHEDITEQRNAEDALRESETRFRTMFYGAPVGISLIDRDGRYLAVNPARQRMLGYSEDEFLGKSYLDFTHEEDLEYDRQVNREALEQGTDSVQLEKRFVRKDGSVEWARITAAGVRNEQGDRLYSISIAEDITSQKHSEQERTRLLALERTARMSVERLAAEQAAILGQIAEGIIIADPTGNITFVNETARDLHGIAVLGTPVDQYADTYHLYTIDGRPYPPEELPLSRAVLRGETVLGAEWLIRRPDGVDVVAQGSAVPVVADDGTRLGAVLTVRDVTAQRRFEQQKDEFLSAVAHDLRTPLTTIKGRVQILQRRAQRPPLDPNDLLDGLARIDGGAGRMIVLINELLEVANIQIGRPIELALQATDLVALARTVVQDYQQATDRHAVTFEHSTIEAIGNWDPTRLERMLSNLLSNALKYSPHGGAVRVEVGRKDFWAVLTVRDQGVGIPADELGSIFGRFRRGRNVAGKIPGTGIGLAAVRDIVEQHGGAISVESEEGAGAVFTVRLPLANDLAE